MYTEKEITEISENYMYFILSPERKKRFISIVLEYSENCERPSQLESFIEGLLVSLDDDFNDTIIK